MEQYFSFARSSREAWGLRNSFVDLSAGRTTTMFTNPYNECEWDGGNYVYLMKNLRNGYTKIGNSTNPICREATLQAEEPEIELLLVFAAHPVMERLLHKFYSEKRVRGEWFNLTKEDFRHILSSSCSMILPSLAEGQQENPKLFEVMLSAPTRDKPTERAQVRQRRHYDRISKIDQVTHIEL